MSCETLGYRINMSNKIPLVTHLWGFGNNVKTVSWRDCFTALGKPSAQGTTITAEGFGIKISSITAVWVSAARTPAHPPGDVERQVWVTSSLYPFNVFFPLKEFPSLLWNIQCVIGSGVDVVLRWVTSLGLQVTEYPTQICLGTMENLLACITENSGGWI